MHRKDAHNLLLKHSSEYQSIIAHESTKVGAKINQRKKELETNCRGIFNASRVQPAYHRRIASNIHRSPLLRRNEVRPHLYRRSLHVDNLQNIGLAHLLKTTSF
jgi:hypothetical protein